jgi:uncharacterized protein YhbP (UPF0306 family)
MPANVTTADVWREIEKRSFAVLGFVTPRGEARTAGIVYAVRDRELYIVTGHDSWKIRHIVSNPHVSLTVTISKRIPFLPWVQIPAATISFQGEASLHAVGDVSPEIPRKLLRGLDVAPALRNEVCVIRIRPAGRFVTYGVGVPLRTMRNPDAARGQAPV